MEVIRRKLEILADAAKYDASCASSGSRRRGRPGSLGSTDGVGICHSYTPDGRCVSLLKLLLTNHCIYDCKYCVNRITSDTPRARFTVDEVVNLTLEFYRRNYIEGLFLSSGIIQSVDYTMEQLIGVAKSLRTVHKFNGYIHLKVVPLASPELLREAGLWADRLSANIEMPTQADLDAFAPEKTLAAATSTMNVLKDGIDESKAERRKSQNAPAFAPAGQSTQMIVGASPSSDATILRTSQELYTAQKLRRVYYSAFSPIPNGDGRLPLQSPPLVREHRLYQADWLMRFYGFEDEELTTPAEPNLDLQIDPKLAWALRHRAFFPVDLNKATQWQMLRVPGLGKRTVDRFIRLRRWHAIRSEDLARLRLPLKKILPWVTTADRNPLGRGLDDERLRDRFVLQSSQLTLFDSLVSAATGEV